MKKRCFKKSTPESLFLNAALKMLCLDRDLFVMRNNTGALKTEHGFIRFGYSGLADISVFHKGKVLFLELKSDKGKQSENQITFQEKVQKVGCLYFVCKTLDEIQNAVNILKTNS